MKNLRSVSILLGFLVACADPGSSLPDPDSDAGVTEPVPADDLLHLAIVAPAEDLVPAVSVQLSVIATNHDGKVVPTPPVEWVSEATSVITIAADGTIEAIAPGAAWITVASHDAKNSLRLTVRDERHGDRD